MYWSVVDWVCASRALLNFLLLASRFTITAEATTTDKFGYETSEAVQTSTIVGCLIHLVLCRYLKLLQIYFSSTIRNL